MTDTNIRPRRTGSTWITALVDAWLSPWDIEISGRPFATPSVHAHHGHESGPVDWTCIEQCIGAGNHGPRRGAAPELHKEAADAAATVMRLASSPRPDGPAR